jgi:hypothetical protein
MNKPKKVALRKHRKTKIKVKKVKKAMLANKKK